MTAIAFEYGSSFSCFTVKQIITNGFTAGRHTTFIAVTVSGIQIK